MKEEVWWSLTFKAGSPEDVDNRRVVIGHARGIVEGYDAELDGMSSPDNPTVAPAEPAAETAGAHVRIPELESFTSDKLVPAT